MHYGMHVLKDKETKALTEAGEFPFKLIAMNQKGPVAESMTRKLQAAFAPRALEVEDESAKHAGHSGARESGESHFRVRIVADAFKGLSRVERQRRIHAALAEEFAKGLHALSINALTPEEVTQRPNLR